MAKKAGNSTEVKQRIFNATLDIIKEKGMRGVRHRAVAERANVSLGSTTYHFKNIEDLISSTFMFWHDKTDVGKNPYFNLIQQDVMAMASGELSNKQLAEKIFDDSEKYLRDQIFEGRDNRLIELSFHNEALRNKQLATLMLNTLAKEAERLAQLYQTLGTADPISDGEITLALILQLEKKALLINDKDQQLGEYEKMKSILKRHIFLTAGIQA